VPSTGSTPAMARDRCRGGIGRCLSGRPYSEETQRTIDTEVSRLLREAETQAVAQLREHRDALDALTQEPARRFRPRICSSGRSLTSRQASTADTTSTATRPTGNGLLRICLICPPSHVPSPPTSIWTGNGYVDRLARPPVGIYSSRVPHDLALKTMNAVHRVLLTMTGNRIGASVGGMPSLQLTTIGRKTGRPHSVMLTSPLQEGDAYVVVASRGGDDIHPAWFLNLRDNPAVEVQFAGKSTQPMRARVASGEERARMWPVIAGKYRNYAGYQKRTEREIPLVLLEP
jgi:deazaflavin-dependent oxidoreductase (nitroreductase family)